MKAQLNVPTGLDEITLRQYQEFIKAQELNNDELFLQQKTIEIFCNVPEAKVKSIAANSVVEITNKINLLFEDRPEFKRFFYLNKVEFGFIPDLDEMSFGEYIDVDTYLSDWKSIHLAINVLYRPIVRKNAGRYEIEPYDTQTQDRALDMPMNAVLSAIFFLFNLKKDLLMTTLSCLTAEVETQQVQLPHLVKSGGGIIPCMDLVKETLNELTTSPKWKCMNAWWC